MSTSVQPGSPSLCIQSGEVKPTSRTEVIKGGCRIWDSDANYWKALGVDDSSRGIPKPEDVFDDGGEIPSLEPVINAKVLSQDGWTTDDEEKVQPVRVSRFWKKPRNAYKVNKIEAKGEQLQLVLSLPVEVGHDRKIAKVLIDTGCEVNLIRKGFWSADKFATAKNPAYLTDASGNAMEGGKKSVRMHMSFRRFHEGQELGSPLWLAGTFYEAEIGVDSIISCPWLTRNKISVFPHYNALAFDQPEFILLRGLTSESAKSRRRRKNRGIHKDTQATGHGRLPSKRCLREVHAEDVFEEDFDKHLIFARKAGFKVTGDELHDPNDLLKEAEIRLVARKLSVFSEKKKVRGIIQVFPSEDAEEAWVEEYRKKIHETYDGIVLREEVIPDPPVRGKYGYAKILLKPDAVPQRQKPFSMHGERNEAMKTITKQWESAKFIEKPTGPVEWVCQAFAVPKKSATFPWRGVVDMRGVNSQTRRANYPLPSIENVLVKQGRNHIFSILDLRQAFHQQPMHPESRPLTCTLTPNGVYQWRVNVMGLMNASTQFQQMMDDRLEPVRDIADAYIDDVLVGTFVNDGEDPRDAHLRDLRRVLDLLAKESLIADISKCKFFLREVEFCGHILGKGARRPAPGKLMAIEKWEPPRTISELRAFLGFTNYYNTYIKEYSKIAAPLQDRLKVRREIGKKGSKHKIGWGEIEQAAFDELKRVLCSELVLQVVNPDRPFVLRVDASEFAVGATLEQLLSEDRMPTTEDVREKRTVPVAFLSRKLGGSQRNWVPRELETYAIILALQKWESWIGLQPILVLTDHKALESWAKEVLDPPSGPIGRRLRWHQILSKHDLSVGYIPGSENTVCDILSRWAYPASIAAKQVSRHGTEQEREQMKEIIRQEREEERQCLWVRLGTTPEEPDVMQVTAIHGKTTGTPTSDPAQVPQQPPFRFTFSKPRTRVTETVPAQQQPPVKPTGSAHEVDGRRQLPAKTRQTSPRSTSVARRESDNSSLASDSSSHTSEQGVEEGLPNVETGVANPPQQAEKLHPSRTTQARRSTGADAAQPILPVHSGPDEQVTPCVHHESDGSEPEADHDVAQHDEPEALTGDWSAFYGSCPRWSESWVATQDPDAEWPVDIRIHDCRMYHRGKLCIPYALQNLWIRHSHSEMGHPSAEKLWQLLLLQCDWAKPSNARAFALGVGRECNVCQACQRPHTLHTELTYAPVPERVMSSVALDILHLPEVDFQEKSYDCAIVCVDRHSGWIVAIPARKRGLTAAVVATKMLKHQWSIFGVPQLITSDLGAQFIGGWFATIAAGLGIRHTFTHPYYHQSAGRVEVANQVLCEVLRKLNVEKGLTWVEALPAALNHIHNTPGVIGLSPCQILFGREKALGNIPYTPSRENEDAQTFFARMKEIDEKVARVLNEVHKKRAAKENSSRTRAAKVRPGQKVWYRRPEGSGNKLDSRWLGPALITKRIGQNSYEVQVGEENFLTAHTSYLKAYVKDDFGGKPIPLFLHKRTIVDEEAQPDEWEVDKIVDVTYKNGIPHFKVHWKGYDEGDAEWEPPNHFFHRYSSPVIAFCKGKGIPLDVTKFLSPHPHSH